MLDLKTIIDQPEKNLKLLETRGAAADAEPLFALNDRRKELQTEEEDLRARRNAVSKEIGKLKGKGEDASAQLAEMEQVAARVKELDEELSGVQEQIESILLRLPNLPAADTPVGKSEDDNVEVRKWGELPEFDFDPLNHWDIGEKLGVLDFERAAKLSGSRFAVYTGASARLERALINYFLDEHTTKNGYREVLPPFLVSRDSMQGTGQLPKFEDDAFSVKQHDLFLIPTAEVPVTNLHRDEILDAEQLPIKYCAYTPCFRAEAGSYGKDTRGLIRQHQFQKVELVKITTPEDSEAEHEALTADAEKMLQALGLPYRVMKLCTGDLGFGARKCYDLEVWLPGQQTYREISSCSNFGDFQARRMKMRYRPADNPKKKRLVHTINGSGLAVGRTVVAILENYQQADGSVIVPEVLRGYMGGLERIVNP